MLGFALWFTLIIIASAIWICITVYYLLQLWKNRTKFPINRRFYKLSICAIVYDTYLGIANTVLSNTGELSSIINCNAAIFFTVLITVLTSMTVTARLTCMLYEFEKNKTAVKKQMEMDEPFQLNAQFAISTQRSSETTWFTRNPRYGKQRFWIYLQIVFTLCLAIIYITEVMVFDIGSNSCLTLRPVIQVTVTAFSLVYIPCILLTTRLIYKINQHERDNLALHTEMKLHLFGYVGFLLTVISALEVHAPSTTSIVIEVVFFVGMLISFYIQLWLPLKMCDYNERILKTTPRQVRVLAATAAATAAPAIATPTDPTMISAVTAPTTAVSLPDAPPMPKIVEVLASPDKFALFVQYCAGEFCSENPIFWLRCQRYAKYIEAVCPSRNTDILQENDAIKVGIAMEIQSIFSTHVATDSSDEVNVEYGSRNTTTATVFELCTKLGCPWRGVDKGQNTHVNFNKSKSLRRMYSTRLKVPSELQTTIPTAGIEVKVPNTTTESDHSVKYPNFYEQLHGVFAEMQNEIFNEFLKKIFPRFVDKVFRNPERSR